MKKFFYLMSLCLCMFAGVAVMTSCGDDDIDDIDPDNIEFKVGITEKGNTLTFTAKTSYYTYVEIATFDSNDKCTKFLEQEIYPSKDYANAAWEAYKAEYKDDPDDWKKYSKDGKTITYDDTEDWAGKSKAEIRSYMEEEQKYFEQYNK